MFKNKNLFSLQLIDFGRAHKFQKNAKKTLMRNCDCCGSEDYSRIFL